MLPLGRKKSGNQEEVQVRVNFGEVWLLEAAVRDRIPLIWLGLGEMNLRAKLNRGFHGMDDKQLLNTLTRMIHNGDIIAYTGHRGEFMPMASELEAAIKLRGEIDLDMLSYYGLTRKGAAKWEHLAKPRWQLFFNDEYPEDNTMQVTTGSRQLRMLVARNALSLFHVQPLSETFSEEVLNPWRATYWKTISSGYRVRWSYEALQCCTIGEDIPLTLDRIRRRWVSSICGNICV
jgi:hypothetical protein